jgi:hypothetical protein
MAERGQAGSLRQLKVLSGGGYPIFHPFPYPNEFDRILAPVSLNSVATAFDSEYT